MRFCLIEEKDEGSILPQINDQLFYIKGIRASYEVVKVPGEKQAKILELTHGFDGFNVGNPYKGIMGNYLDVLCPRAKISGSVDTVVRKGLNFVGYNTESSAFVKAMEFSGLNLCNNVAIVGHSAEAISYGIEAAERGSSITFLTQNFSAGLKAVNLIAAKYRNLDVTHAPPGSLLKDNTLLISGVSRGEFDHVAENIFTHENLGKIKGFFETDFALRRSDVRIMLERVGIPCSDGLRMIVEKVAASHNIWIGTKYDRDELDATYLKVKFALSVV